MIAVVLIVIRVAGVKSVTTRNGLDGAALIKATFTLAGFGTILPISGTSGPTNRHRCCHPRKSDPYYYYGSDWCSSSGTLWPAGRSSPPETRRLASR